MSANAIELLKEDHAKVKRLLAELEETDNQSGERRSELLQQIANELKVHTKIEEEVFYPAFRKSGAHDERQKFHEAVEEHRAVESLVLPDLEQTNPASDQFAGRAKVLKELVEHHVEEEESDVFPKAEAMFDASQLASMGQQMEDLKQRYLP